jgi:hypothetical protein
VELLILTILSDGVNLMQRETFNDRMTKQWTLQSIFWNSFPSGQVMWLLQNSSWNKQDVQVSYDGHLYIILTLSVFNLVQIDRISEDVAPLTSVPWGRGMWIYRKSAISEINDVFWQKITSVTKWSCTTDSGSVIKDYLLLAWLFLQLFGLMNKG